MLRVALFFLCSLGLGWATPVFSGYSLQVIASSPGYSAVGVQTTCYVFPSMAVRGNLGSSAYVSAYDVVNSTITAGISPATNAITYRWYSCSSSPVSTALPLYAPGISDPVLDGVLSLNGGVVTNPKATVSPDIIVKVDPAVIQPVAPDMAVRDSVSLFGFGITLLSFIWSLKRIYSLFSDSSSV